MRMPYAVQGFGKKIPQKLEAFCMKLAKVEFCED